VTDGRPSRTLRPWVLQQCGYPPSGPLSFVTFCCCCPYRKLLLPLPDPNHQVQVLSGSNHLASGAFIPSQCALLVLTLYFR
jgi:hypothetical protein